MFLSGEMHATCRRMRIPLWLPTAIHSMAAIPRKYPNTSIAGISWRAWRFDSSESQQHERLGQENHRKICTQLRPRGLGRGTSLSRWWRGRGHKFGVVYGNILLKLLHLDGELVSRPRKGPAKRNLQPVGFAIIRIINLRRIASQRRFAVADEAQQKAGLFVEIEAEWRLPFVTANDEVGVMAVDLFSGVHLEFFIKRFHMQREV